MRRKRFSSSWQAAVLQNPISAAFNGGWGLHVLHVVLHVLDVLLDHRSLPACVAECISECVSFICARSLCSYSMQKLALVIDACNSACMRQVETRLAGSSRLA